MKKFKGTFTEDGEIYYDSDDEYMSNEKLLERTIEFQQDFINKFATKFSLEASKIIYSLRNFGLDENGKTFQLKTYKQIDDDMLKNLKKADRVYVRKDNTPIPIQLYRIDYV